MSLLALETATLAPSVALLRESETWVERLPSQGSSGSEHLLPAIDAVLRAAGTEIAAVDGFALAIGPGSFTGLRVGLSVLKGLAFAGDQPVAAVSSLEALARSVGEKRDAPVLACLDARRDEVYAAGFERGAELTVFLPEGLYAPDEIAGRLPADCALVGDGAALCVQALGACGHAAPRVLEPDEPLAAAVAWLGARRLARGEGVPAGGLAPRYLRRAEAEARRMGRPSEP